jgi:hypothetical protein
MLEEARRAEAVGDDDIVTDLVAELAGDMGAEHSIEQIAEQPPFSEGKGVGAPITVALEILRRRPHHPETVVTVAERASSARAMWRLPRSRGPRPERLRSSSYAKWPRSIASDNALAQAYTEDRVVRLEYPGQSEMHGPDQPASLGLWRIRSTSTLILSA